MSFLAPAMLAGLVLASAPIIIHLLNRRRFIRVDWAPMKYLKLTIKTNRRRLRLEQWLLLALRTLAVLALVLAVARPVGSGMNLAGFLDVRGRASRVIVIDDSLSMSAKTNGQASFDRAKEVAVQILDALGEQDSITVVRTSQPDAPLVRHAQPDAAQGARLRESIRQLQVRQSASHWPSILAAVDAHLQTAVYPIRDVLLITDLWAAGWSGESAELGTRWENDKTTVRIFDVGADPAGDRFVAELVQSSPLALVHTPVTFTATIRNIGAEPLQSEQAILTVDDATQTLSLPAVDTDATVDVPITLTFDEPGQHRVALQLPADVLPDDDTRRLMVNVRRDVAVTLVDGDPGVQPFESETDFLEVALTAGNAAWQATRLISSEWLEQPLAAPDIIVLANVAGLTPTRVAELEELVAAGTGLMLFVGDQLDVEEFNRLLDRDGKGLLPARLVQFRDAEVTGLVLEPLADSPIAMLGKLTPEALSRVRPKRFADVQLSEGDQAAVRVLARWNDPQQSPALVEKQFGKGRVLLWTVTADRAWSDWPVEASFVLAMRLAAQGIAAQAETGANLICGEPIIRALDPQLAPQEFTLATPDSADELTLPVDRTDPQRPRLFASQTHAAGFYTAHWDESAADLRCDSFAINAEWNDARQQRLTTADLPTYFGTLTPKVIEVAPNAKDIATTGNELWRYLMFGVLGFLGLESCLACWVGRVR